MPPLKRIPEFRSLSEDHHNALVIALRCRRIADGSLDADRDDFWAGALEFFRLQVWPHFEVEEALLLPALEALGKHDMAERIASEHVRIKALVEQGSSDDQTLAELGVLLNDHVRYEERVVFEEVQHEISADVLRAIDEASTAVPQICPTTFKPLARGT